MRNFKLAACVAILPMLTVPAFAQEDPVVANINGSQLLLSDLERAYSRLPDQYRQAPLEAIFEPLLEQMIDGELILGEAESANLADDPEIAAEIANARDNVLRQAFVGRSIESAMTDEALLAAYQDKKAEPGFSFEEVKARHILLEDEEAAKAVIEALDGGADFAELAKEKSTGPSGPNGGDLGYFRQGAMVPEFGNAAFSMEPGTYSAEPVKTDFGFHVIMVEDKRMNEPSFEETEQELRQAIADTTITELVAGLRDGAEIERFNIDGSAKEAAN